MSRRLNLYIGKYYQTPQLWRSFASGEYIKVVAVDAAQYHERQFKVIFARSGLPTGVQFLWLTRSEIRECRRVTGLELLVKVPEVLQSGEFDTYADR